MNKTFFFVASNKKKRTTMQSLARRAAPGTAPQVAGLHAGRAAYARPAGRVGQGVPTRRRSSPAAAAAAPTDPAPPSTTSSFSPQPVTIPFRLNTTPTPRPTRAFFYEEAANGIDAALADGVSTRLAVRVTIPETDKSFDSYRVATILEMVRTSVGRLTGRGLRTRVCVQGP